MIELAKELRHLGVDGILSVTPYYNKPTQEGLVSALQGDRGRGPAADRSSIACRDAPASNVEPATLKRLAEIDNIVGVKEASGNIGQMAQMVHRASGALRRPVRRRFDHHSADRAGRTRSDFRGVERNSRRR